MKDLTNRYIIILRCARDESNRLVIGCSRVHPRLRCTSPCRSQGHLTMQKRGAPHHAKARCTSPFRSEVHLTIQKRGAPHHADARCTSPCRSEVHLTMQKRGAIHVMWYKGIVLISFDHLGVVNKACMTAHVWSCLFVLKRHDQPCWIMTGTLLTVCNFKMTICDKYSIRGQTLRSNCKSSLRQH